MRTDKILFQMLTTLHGKCHFSLRIHDVYRSDGSEPVIFSRFQMILGISTSTPVSRVTFHDSSLHLLHQILDQSRLQKIMSTRFSRG